MANINLPARFETKLFTDQFLLGTIKITISRFGEIYKDNKLFFFEEYTDHGIAHIERVASSSDNLIPQETFDSILTSQDVGCHVLAVLLHDIGMHINLNGFKFLIDGGFDHVRVKEFDRKSWKELWQDFLTLAKRYSGKALKSIFGNENLIIRIPPLNKTEEINGYDKKLIGEFLRRNHARLAHEIAIEGFPINGGVIDFATELDIKTRNVIGAIARSHGMDLRKCLDYIELIYGRSNRRYPNNTHAVYLMVLLRLADYIQIDRSRTSKTLIKTKTFSSPISEMEHSAHISINAIDDKYQDDPEKIFVEAYPEDSKMYLKIKRLVADIQREFDISWAVLGELYGRIPQKPEIKYRRITSNLVEDLFISGQRYVADSFSFKANHEIVKLLIAPLYGDDPKYGVRELLQNAVDACRERQQLAEKSGDLSYLPEVEVKVINDQGLFLIISDNGIGMDVDVIKNYFLNAGASYRQSLEWQHDYLNEQGKSIVVRNGRFGIGILAAFIIGNTIGVETRKFGNSSGYRFKTSLDVDQIDVLKDASIKEGTRIVIEINEDILTKLEPKGSRRVYGEPEWFEWFTLDTPSISYSFLGKKLVSSFERNPGLKDTLPKYWTEIQSDGFNKIFWKYRNYADNFAICNGFLIPVSYFPKKILDLGLISNDPKVHIFDNDGILPLTLNRNGFSDRVSFENDLKESLYMDYLAYLLVSKMPNVTKDKIQFNGERFVYPGISGHHDRNNEDFSYGVNIYAPLSEGGVSSQLLERVLISKKGFIIDYNYFIQKLKEVNIIFIQADELFGRSISLNLDLNDKFLYFSDSFLNTIDQYRQAIEGKNYDYETYVWGLNNSRIYLKNDRFAYLFDPLKKRTTVDLRQRIKIVFNQQDWVGFHLDHGPDFRVGYGVGNNTSVSTAFFEQYGKLVNFVREYKSQCPYNGDEIFNTVLRRYIGDDVIIPFSISEREKKFPLAFKELQKYMVKYESARE